MNKNLDLSGLSSDLNMSRYLNSSSEAAGFSPSSPMSASCSFMDIPVRRAKMNEGLSRSSSDVILNKTLSDSSRKILDKSGDEFWAALKSHYTYLMDDELITTCKEASGELSWDDEDLDDGITWSFKEFIYQFDNLCSWLDSMQKSVNERNDENMQALAANALTEMSQSEDMKNKMCLRTTFNEQSKKLGKRYPDMKDEILNRVVILNKKWDALEQVIKPGNDISDHDGLLKDVISKVKCLRRWLHLLETKIQPLIVNPEWTLQCLEEKLKENTVLQKEIESYSKFISSVLNTFERLCTNESTAKCKCKQIRRFANSLEKRWHNIWLKSLEWRCMLDELISKCKDGVSILDSSFELSFRLGEPQSKVPRLGPSSTSFSTVQNDSTMLDFDASVNSSANGMQIHQENISTGASNITDKGMMVGEKNISELKSSCSGLPRELEMIQDIGYSSASPVNMFNECAENDRDSSTPGQDSDNDVKRKLINSSSPVKSDDELNGTTNSTPKVEFKSEGTAKKGLKNEQIEQWLSELDVTPIIADGSYDACEEDASNESGSVLSQFDAAQLEISETASEDSQSSSVVNVHKTSSPIAKSMQQRVSPRRRGSGRKRKINTGPEGLSLNKFLNVARSVVASESDSQARVPSYVSDLTWDGYVYPMYPNEACAEFKADDEVRKRILRRQFMNLPKTAEDNSDSDSDVEEFHHFISESIGQLEISQAMLKKHLEIRSIDIANTSINYAELEATCQTNVDCLQVLEEQLSTVDSELAEIGLPRVQGIKKQWAQLIDEAIQCRYEDNRVRYFVKSIQEFKKQLYDISRHLAMNCIDNYNQLCDWVVKHESALKSIGTIKEDLPSFESTIHSCGHNTIALQQDFTSVYHSCEDIYERCNTQLKELLNTKSRWNHFLNQYIDLRNRVDEHISRSPQKNVNTYVHEIKEELSRLRRHVSEENLSDTDSGILLWEEASDLLAAVETQIDCLISYDSDDSNAVMKSEKTSKDIVASRPINESKENSDRWRLFKYSLACQVSLAIIYWFSWLLEPCCKYYINE